jgi:hypothetical protein
MKSGVAVNVHDDRGTFTALSLVAFVACVLTACGTERPTMEVPSPAPASAHVETVEGVVFPLDAYRPTPEQETLFANARRYSLASCLSRFGFDGYDRTRLPVGSAPSSKDRGYLFITLSQAARYGYAAPPEKGGTTKDRSRRRETSMEEIAVLSGEGRLTTYKGRAIPDGGCTGEAARVVAAGSASDDEGLAMVRPGMAGARGKALQKGHIARGVMA